MGISLFGLFLLHWLSLSLVIVFESLNCHAELVSASHREPALVFHREPSLVFHREPSLVLVRSQILKRVQDDSGGVEPGNRVEEAASRFLFCCFHCFANGQWLTANGGCLVVQINTAKIQLYFVLTK